MRARVVAVLVSSLVALTAGMAATPASAGVVQPKADCAVSVEPNGTQLQAGAEKLATCCVVNTIYDITSHKSVRVPFQNVPTFKNGPGGTMSVTKSYSGTATAAVTVGVSAEIGSVLAKAKASVDSTLTASNSTGATNNYTRNITAGKFGNAQYVSYGKSISYRKYRRNSNCTTTTLRTGTINYPSSSEGWYYWETSS